MCSMRTGSCWLNDWTATSVRLRSLGIPENVSSYVISYGDFTRRVNRSISVDELSIANLNGATNYEFTVSFDTGGSFSCVITTCT